MNKNRTDIIIVLDRSGSMASTVNDVIGGFNKLIDDQINQPGEAYVTLVQFNNIEDIIYDQVNVKHVKKLDRSNYLPAGGTALLDAIGTTISDVGRKYAEMKESDRPSKVVCVIMTDGEENASREYTRDKIFDMISHQKDKYNWQFLFIGANQDAIQAGNSIGIRTANSANYAANSRGTQAVYQCISDGITSYRSGEAEFLSFNENDRAKMEGKE